MDKSAIALIQQVKDYLSLHGIKIATVAAMFILGFYLINLITGLQKKHARKTSNQSSKTLYLFMASIVEWSLKFFLIIFCATYIGLDSFSLAALIGTIGIAIGLAMKDTLSNFMSGILILMLKPFRVGDVVEITSGYIGVVDAIHIFSTRILTFDNRRVVVPNILLTNNIVVNRTGEHQRRVDLEIGISYDSDIRLAKEIIVDILTKNIRILRDPQWVVGVKELGDSAVIILVRPWCKSDEVLLVQMEVIEAIKLAFDAQGIIIPFPQRDVHIYNKVK